MTEQNQYTNDIEARVTKVVEKKFPMPERNCFKKATEEARRGRYRKLMDQLKGLAPEQIEICLKRWENEN